MLTAAKTFEEYFVHFSHMTERSFQTKRWNIFEKCAPSSISISHDGHQIKIQNFKSYCYTRINLTNFAQVVKMFEGEMAVSLIFIDCLSGVLFLFWLKFVKTKQKRLDTRNKIQPGCQFMTSLNNPFFIFSIFRFCKVLNASK